MLKMLKEIFGKSTSRFNSADVSILLVDDSPVDRKVVEAILVKNKFKLLIAENGQQGLDLARKEKLNLIILDCEMPVMTGPEMCQMLKQDDVLKNIPVLFLTSMDTPKNIVECFQMDAENFLSKPISAKVLLTQIEQILDESIK